MPRERGEKVIATNRRARHDYNIEKSYEAGMVLTGTEVKSLRQGRANLSDGYAFVKGNEVFLDAVHIPEYSQGHWTNHSAKRIRKLLLHREEIAKLAHAVGRIHAHPAQAVLLRRSRQGRDRSREGQARVRQASDPPRTPGHP